MKPYLTIGRSSSCDIIVPHPSVSRNHARVYASGNVYVYENTGKNGSSLNGQMLPTGKTVITPGANVLLAGQVPLPWSQIYSMLPLKGRSPYSEETICGDAVNNCSQPAIGYNNYQPVQNDDYDRSIAIGWAILALLLPIAGWIMYFVWKDDTPKRARQACTLAWIGFVFNLIIII